MERERGDIERYINLFGYNPKYGPPKPQIGSVRYEPQPYQRQKLLNGPIFGISMMAANARPIISKIPADIANTEKPIPCMQKRTTLTPVSGM